MHRSSSLSLLSPLLSLFSIVFSLSLVEGLCVTHHTVFDSFLVSSQGVCFLLLLPLSSSSPPPPLTHAYIHSRCLFFCLIYGIVFLCSLLLLYPLPLCLLQLCFLFDFTRAEVSLSIFYLLTLLCSSLTPLLSLHTVLSSLSSLLSASLSSSSFSCWLSLPSVLLPLLSTCTLLFSLFLFFVCVLSLSSPSHIHMHTAFPFPSLRLLSLLCVKKMCVCFKKKEEKKREEEEEEEEEERIEKRGMMERIQRQEVCMCAVFLCHSHRVPSCRPLYLLSPVVASFLLSPLSFSFFSLCLFFSLLFGVSSSFSCVAEVSSLFSLSFSLVFSFTDLFAHLFTRHTAAPQQKMKKKRKKEREKDRKRKKEKEEKIHTNSFLCLSLVSLRFFLL